MFKPALKKSHKLAERPPFDRIALLLQGGGALGAYQAGVYEALAEAGLHPDWIAGISIGALNAAIIAGNPPEARVDKLRAFWEHITAPASWTWTLPDGSGGGWLGNVIKGNAARAAANQISAFRALFAGAAGFFVPRALSPWLYPSGSHEATSFYDTSDLRATLERLVDFDRINAGETRFSVGTVNVRTGNFVYFDTTTHTIRPEHAMASGALPPGFPAVEIEGECYWDGGLVSNTPLQWVIDSGPPRDTLIFQVDLWNARGEVPGTLAEVITRQKEIQYSSRTRAATDFFKHVTRLRAAIATLLPQMPDALRNSPEAKLLESVSEQHVYNIVHLIYRSQHYEGHSKDYDFSRLTMEEHWRAGYHDAIRTLRHPEVLQRPDALSGVFTFDLGMDGQG
jgi:NTE family protein